MSRELPRMFAPHAPDWPVLHTTIAIHGAGHCRDGENSENIGPYLVRIPRVARLEALGSPRGETPRFAPPLARSSRLGHWNSHLAVSVDGHGRNSENHCPPRVFPHLSAVCPRTDADRSSSEPWSSKASATVGPEYWGFSWRLVSPGVGARFSTTQGLLSSPFR